jgi:hypothetical protein
MIGVHLVWGASTAAAMRELVAVRRTMIASGPARDAPGEAAEPLNPRAD